MFSSLSCILLLVVSFHLHEAAFFVYTYDIMGRVIPDLKDYLFVGPFSFTNASEIFADHDAPEYSLLLAAIITAAALVSTYLYYTRKDLAS